jgi:predicted DNA-binding protein
MITCNHPKKFARGMCSACYQAARRAGELEPKEALGERVTFRLPDEVRERAEASAKSERVTLGTWVRRAVEQRLRRDVAEDQVVDDLLALAVPEAFEQEKAKLRKELGVRTSRPAAKKKRPRSKR